MKPPCQLCGSTDYPSIRTSCPLCRVDDSEYEKIMKQEYDNQDFWSEMAWEAEQILGE